LDKARVTEQGVSRLIIREIWRARTCPKMAAGCDRGPILGLQPKHFERVTEEA
jgi:hypothetical protein